MDNFNKLVDLFLERDELGHYNEKESSISLYNIEKSKLNEIRNLISKITTKYKLIANSNDDRTNVQIIDIDL